MTWTTIKKAGHPTGSSFNYPITGLTPSTRYEYRSYMVVDGIEYTGNTLTGNTSAIQLLVPEAKTGNANSITLISLSVSGNEVISNGGAVIIEYGILYTQNGSFSNNSTLVYDNVGVSVKKTSSYGNVTLPYDFGAVNLLSNTMTYYRAFLRNAIGVGYGYIESVKTLPAPTVDVYFSINAMDEGLIMADNFINQRMEILLSYSMQAFCDNNYDNDGDYPQQGIASFEISYNDGDTWTTIKSIYIAIYGPQEYDVQNDNGTLSLNVIKSTLDSIRLRGIIDVKDGGRSTSGGSIDVTISTVDIDSGDVQIISPTLYAQQNNNIYTGG